MHGELSIQVVTDAGARTVRASAGQTLAQALQSAGIRLNMRCAGRGLCEGCTVEFHETRIRACQHIPSADSAPFIIPERSLLAYQPKVVSEFRVNVSRAHDPLAEVPGMGAVIDIGTTTVAVLTVDLSTGQVLRRGAAFNRQMELGDDVLTRINLCCQDDGAVAHLQSLLIAGTIAPLLEEVDGELEACVIAGNTTMLHLFAGINPAPMGTAPYTPVFLEHQVIHAPPGWPQRLARCPVHLLPGSAAYVGADLAAGALASGLLYDEGPSLLVDVGTNGEIILAHDGEFFGCATAAGPAFEGAGLSSGVRAGDGAIAHLRITCDDRLELDVINEKRPMGLCGSAYIDFLAEARRAHWINATGRFERDDPRIANLPGCGKVLTLAGEGPSAVMISEADIARLLAAKAAVAAGVLTLLRRCSLAPGDIRRVYLAGGFGTHMSPRHAIACGLLSGFHIDQVEAVGNSALAGAYLALLDRTALEEMEHLARRVRVLDLNHDPDFENTYIDQLSLPCAD